ncbi:hypothetical protein TYRP_004988, partial [Tyrophagus putrescentiae]
MTAGAGSVLHISSLTPAGSFGSGSWLSCSHSSA